MGQRATSGVAEAAARAYVKDVVELNHLLTIAEGGGRSAPLATHAWATRDGAARRVRVDLLVGGAALAEPLGAVQLRSQLIVHASQPMRHGAHGAFAAAGQVRDKLVSCRLAREAGRSSEPNPQPALREWGTAAQPYSRIVKSATRRRPAATTATAEAALLGAAQLALPRVPHVGRERPPTRVARALAISRYLQRQRRRRRCALLALPPGDAATRKDPLRRARALLGRGAAAGRATLRRGRGRLVRLLRP